MGRAEDIVKARQAEQSSQSERLNRRLASEAAIEMMHLIPEFLQLMDTLSYPDYSKFIEWKGEEYIAWELYDHVGEGDIRGDRLHLLSTGTILHESALSGEYYEVDLSEKVKSTYSSHHDFPYNAEKLRNMVARYTVQLGDSSE